MKIALACDHAGLSLKEAILRFLNNRKIEVLDFSPPNSDRVDYPDYAIRVAEKVSRGGADAGGLVCLYGVFFLLRSRRRNVNCLTFLKDKKGGAMKSSADNFREPCPEKVLRRQNFIRGRRPGAGAY